MLIEKKPDLDRNRPGVAEAMAKQRKREQRLHPLRINAQTVILVPRGKCNKAYAKEYQNRINRVGL
jgi:hypothetical protein